MPWDTVPDSFISSTAFYTVLSSSVSLGVHEIQMTNSSTPSLKDITEEHELKSGTVAKYDSGCDRFSIDYYNL